MASLTVLAFVAFFSHATFAEVRYEFEYKNRVLPEHCELIYYGACRNTMQCNVCDKNRIAREGDNPLPATFCQKNSSGTSNDGGNCKPCTGCLSFSDEDKIAWKSLEESADCRSPTICPDVMDNMEKELNKQLQEYKDQIAELEEKLKSQTEPDTKSDIDSEIAQLKAEILNSIQNDTLERQLLLEEELRRLEDDKQELKDWAANKTKECADAAIKDDKTCNMSYTEMINHIEKTRLQTIQNTVLTENHTHYSDENKQESIEALANLSSTGGIEDAEDLKDGNKDAMEQTNTSEILLAKLDELTRQLEDTKRKLENIEQATETTALNTPPSSASSGKNNVENIGVIIAMIILAVVILIAIIIIFRRQNRGDKSQEDINRSLLLKEQFEPDEEELEKPYLKHNKIRVLPENPGERYIETMNAWENYDEDECMTLSADRIREDALQGQLGYVTSSMPNGLLEQTSC